MNTAVPDPSETLHQGNRSDLVKCGGRVNRVLHVACGLGTAGGMMSYVRSASSLEIDTWKQQVWKHRRFVAADPETYVCEGHAKVTDRGMFQDLIRGVWESGAVCRWLDQRSESVLLHAHSRVGLVAAALAARRRRLSAILHIHKLPGKPGFYRALARWSKSRLVFNSVRTATWMGEVSPEATILHPFVDWPTSPAPVAAHERLVAAGAFVRVKRFDRLIEAVRVLRGRGCEIPLIIYGHSQTPSDPAHQSVLERLAATVPGVELRKHNSSWQDELREGDLFVHAGTQEAFGIVILEAYARGCRIVVPQGLFVPELGLGANLEGVTMASMTGATELADAISSALARPSNAAEFWSTRKESRGIFGRAAAAERLGALYNGTIAGSG